MHEDDYGYNEESYDDLHEDYEDDVDHMLGALSGEEDDDEDLSERRRRPNKWKGARPYPRPRPRPRPRPPIATPSGNNPYPERPGSKPVPQKQLKEALGRVGLDVRRNAMGIKAVNERLATVDRRVDGVVSVNRLQSGHIAKIEKQMKLDGALEFAESFQSVDGGTMVLNPFQLFKGAIKSGMLGNAKGALGSPVVVGLLGLVLSQPGILGGLLNTGTPPSDEETKR